MKIKKHQNKKVVTVSSKIRKYFNHVKLTDLTIQYIHFKVSQVLIFLSVAGLHGFVDKVNIISETCWWGPRGPEPCHLALHNVIKGTTCPLTLCIAFVCLWDATVPWSSCVSYVRYCMFYRVLLFWQKEIKDGMRLERALSGPMKKLARLRGMCCVCTCAERWEYF